MKILVATSDVPFVEGGHRVIAHSLVHALREAGHSAEILITPQNRFGRQFAGYLATWLTDAERSGTGEVIDLLISTRFPSYALRHPRHVCWLNHRMREYYDLWDEWTAHLSLKGKIKERVRKKCIHAADRYFLTNGVKRVFAQSKNIQQGLSHWGNIPSEVLYPPAPQRKYYTEDYGDFIFSPSRLTPLKRVPLLVEALAKAKQIRAVIAGEGPEQDKIKALITQSSMQDRVKLLGHVDEKRLLELYASCRAIYYAPLREDYGLVTLEAFSSKKCVITAVDSAGPTELVQHRKTGIVTNPEPAAVAEALDELIADPALAQKWGEAGHKISLDINWENTIARLLAA